MLDQIKELSVQIEQAVITNAEQSEQFRLQYLSRKGILNDLFEQFKAIPNDQKKAVGQALNLLKQAAQQKWESTQSQSKKVAAP
ncbi:MAG: phenylalanine--tRNA ligase subunit alpha, partial [Flavobacteriales bacterium]